jgi:fused signal recognition particle receptor
MLGALRKLRDGLAKTRAGFVQTLRGALGERRAIDEGLLEEIEATLLSGDVGVRATGRIVDALRAAAARGDVRTPEDSWAVIRREALALLTAPGGGSVPGSPGTVRASRPALPHASPPGAATPSRRGWRAPGEVVRGPETQEAEPPSRPSVLLVVGVNGVGKTTTIGKLARRLTRGGRRVLLAAGDTFRAAGSEQLEIWGERAGAEVVRQEKGSDPASVAFDAYARARARAFDTLIVDTAGRLHTKSNLVEELKKVRRVLAKQDPTLPDEVLLVLDATTGQNALAQARTFASEVGVTGIVVTKLDGTSKGGVLLSLTEELGIPVRYIGVGEGEDDLEDFDPEAFVAALLGEDA